MFTQRFTLAGWLAIISAVLIVPEIFAIILIDRLAQSIPILSGLVALLKIVHFFISIYLIYMLKTLLNERFNFHGADVYLWIMLAVAPIFAVLGLLGMIPSLKILMGIVVIVLFVPYNIVTILFGASLLKMGDDLFCLLSPFAYTTIASGICGVTVILMPIGMLIGLAALIIEGMIFLRAKEQVEFV
jgi:hypothetical protein